MDLRTLIESERARVTAPERQQETDEMIRRYGQLFSPEYIPNLSAEEFTSFLAFKNNRHWMGINRQSGLLTRDMKRLRDSLSILVDEDQPIQERLEKLFPQGQPGFIKGLGRAVATPILAVVYPSKYGVFNSKSEYCLKYFGLLPNFKTKTSFAERYLAVNETLIRLAREHNLALLELDEVFGWFAENKGKNGDNNGPQEDEGESTEDIQKFGLERLLSDFLVYNWDKTPLGKRYELYEEDGDIGQEYHTPIGRIDLLAKDRQTGDWVIIELKRGRGSDVAVGQLLRYIGWVQENLAHKGESVKGILVAAEADDRLRYALKTLGDMISMITYTVQFQMQETSL